MQATARVSGFRVEGGVARPASFALAEETAVAMVYGGTTQAVLMATPADLEAFGLGFSLTERIVATPGEIESLEVAVQPRGIEVRMWLADHRAEALAARRRFMAGPVGCGLCGLDSIGEVLRPVPPVAASVALSAADVAAAVAGLGASQPLHDETRAVHAAGFYRPGEGIVAAFEDVGRHNALDKLVGGLARGGIDPAGGAVVMTSRVSVDLVQKVAVAGVPALIGVSAPTAHAVRLAAEAGVILAAQVRDAGFAVFSHAGCADTEGRDVA